MSSPTFPLSAGPRFASITSTDHAGAVWIASVLCLIYSTLTLVIRGHIKWKLYGLDDWLITASTAAQLGQVVAIFIALQHGLGISDNLMSTAQLAVAGKAVFTSQIFFILSLCLAKCSVLTLMMRLFNLSAGGSDSGRFYYSKTWVGFNAVLLGVVIWGIASVVGLCMACSPNGFIQDSTANQCPKQLLRWKLIVAFDIVTELILVALPAFIVWPVQMSYQRKGQVVMAFGFRVPVAVFAILHLHFVGNYVHVSNRSFDIIPALVWQQIELCWSLVSASIPNLKSFMKSFSTGLGMEGDLTTHHSHYDLHYKQGSRGGSRGGGGGSQGHQLQSLRHRGASRDGSKQQRTLDSFRPDIGEYSATVEHGVNAHKEPRDAASISTNSGSQDMIIQKDVKYDVRYEDAQI